MGERHLGHEVIEARIGYVRHHGIPGTVEGPGGEGGRNHSRSAHIGLVSLGATMGSITRDEKRYAWIEPDAARGTRLSPLGWRLW